MGKFVFIASVLTVFLYCSLPSVNGTVEYTRCPTEGYLSGDPGLDIPPLPCKPSCRQILIEGKLSWQGPANCELCCAVKNKTADERKADGENMLSFSPTVVYGMLIAMALSLIVNIGLGLGIFYLLRRKPKLDLPIAASDQRGEYIAMEVNEENITTYPADDLRFTS